MQAEQEELLTIFHFNDVYNIQPGQVEPKGGAAYFNTLLHREKQKYKHHLTLFSGDAFSPSLLSTQFQGQNMVKPLQSLGVDLACLGNHDLDFPLPRSKQLTEKAGFPWLLSNIINKETGRRLIEGLETYIINKNGIKIGFFSLTAAQWLDTLYPCVKQICIHLDYIEFAKKMVNYQRNQQNCDMIIALTHMMRYDDKKLAKAVQGIDLILGGHDHLIVNQLIKDSLLVKSGQDFQYFSVIKIQKNLQNESQKVKNSRWAFEVQLKQVNHSLHKIQPNPQLHSYISEMYQKFKAKKQKVACFTLQKMDLTFATIRKEQSSYLQFIVSMYRFESRADIAIMNSGNFRMDTVVEAGAITFGVIQNIIFDKVVVVKVPAKVLIQTLENCVSKYPNLAGRYSSFSGIGFTWDASKKPGERVLVETIRIHQSQIDMNRIYNVAVHSFVAEGGDGYECLKACQRIKSDADKTNHQIIHSLLHDNRYLLDQYEKKYPNRFKEIQIEGHKYLELNLPPPKNVHMIMSTGQPYVDH